MSRPLGSTATPASSGFMATTGRSASERRDWYSVPSVSAVGRLPLTTRATTPRRYFDARLLTFRARAADQAHAASTPDIAWPGMRAPARLIPRGYQGPPVSMPSHAFRRLNSARPPRELPEPGASGTSSWSPPDPVMPGLFPGRSPRQSSANAAPGGLTPTPAGPTPEGQQASISRTAPPMSGSSYTTPPSAFVTHW